MASTIPNLWPDGIKTTVLTPLVILRHQAADLEQRTSGILRGEVRSVEGDDTVEHQFDIVAPALGYEHRILKVQHAKEMIYPARVQADALGARPPQPPNTVMDDEEFINWLAEVLRSGSMKAVILSLIARANEQTKSSDHSAE